MSYKGAFTGNDQGNYRRDHSFRGFVARGGMRVGLIRDHPLLRIYQ